MNRRSMRRRLFQMPGMQATAVAGWYPDPRTQGSTALRWWDGTGWTADIREQVPEPGTDDVAGPAERHTPGEIIHLPSNGRRQVVGEHYYQAALERVCRGKRVPRAGDEDCWDQSLSATARLVAEKDNPYDQTAVRVEVQGMTVGHLPREDASVLHPYLTAVQHIGQHAECEGRIVIASNGDFSIYLHLADLAEVISALELHGAHVPAGSLPPGAFSDETSLAREVTSTGCPIFTSAELEDARLTYQTNYNHRSMNCGRGSAEITAVTSTSRFQDVLRQVAAAPRPWRHPLDRHVPAVVVRDPQKEATVAVLIDGYVIGFLDREMAEQHSDQLLELERAGQYLVCSALVVGGGGRHYGVRLQIKPDIGKRWAANARPTG